MRIIIDFVDLILLGLFVLSAITLLVLYLMDRIRGSIKSRKEKKK